MPQYRAQGKRHRNEKKLYIIIWIMFLLHYFNTSAFFYPLLPAKCQMHRGKDGKVLVFAVENVKTKKFFLNEAIVWSLVQSFCLSIHRVDDSKRCQLKILIIWKLLAILKFLTDVFGLWSFITKTSTLKIILCILFSASCSSYVIYNFTYYYFPSQHLRKRNLQQEYIVHIHNM